MVRHLKAAEDPLNRFVQAYITALLWAETDEEEPLDTHYSEDDIHPESMKAIRAECDKFLKENLKWIENGTIPAKDNLTNCVYSQAGHDFLLTRNNHGVGYWDREEIWGVAGAKYLTKAAKDAKETYPEVGDDGKIHVR